MAKTITSFIRGIIYPKGSTPLKWKEIGILFVSLFSTAMTITMLFPFLPAMVKFFGKTEEETGYYAGLIASSMFLGRFISSYFWGMLADRIGRKPVIFTSLVILGINTFFFGLSSSVTMAIVTRFLVGLGNGVIGTSKAMISEVCDSTNQSLGMSTITIAFTTGLIIGPALGGFLSETGLKYPETFPKGSFFDRYPFLLPCLVNTGLLVFSATISFKFLPETLIKSKKSDKDSKCSQLCRIFLSTKEETSVKTTEPEEESLKLKEIGNTLPAKHEDHSVRQNENALFLAKDDTSDTISSLTKQEKQHGKLSADNASETQNEYVTSVSSSEKVSLSSGDLSNVQHEQRCERKGNVKKHELAQVICDDDTTESKEDCKEHGQTLNDVEDVQRNDKAECSDTKNETELCNRNGSQGLCDNICNNSSDNNHDKDDVTESELQSTNRTISRELEAQSSLTGRDGNDAQSEHIDIRKDNLPTVLYADCENKDNHLQNGTRRRTENANDSKEKKALCCSITSNKNSPLRRILRNRNAVLVLATYVLFAFSNTGSDELIYVWAAADPSLGGLGFSTDQMGTFLLITGIVITILQPTFLPKIERRLGCLMNFQASVIVNMFISVLLPSIRIASNRSDIIWPLLLFSLVGRKVTSCAAYLSVFLLLNNSVQRDLLCSVNGLGITLSSLSRAVSPTIGGILFSWSLSSGRTLGFPFNVNMAFIFFGLLLVINIAVSCFINENLNKPIGERETVLESRKSVENTLTGSKDLREC